MVRTAPWRHLSTSGLFQTARWRLVAWNVAVFALLLLALELPAYGVFSSRIYTEVDNQLKDRMYEVQSQVARYNYNPLALFEIQPSFVELPYRTLVANSQGQVQYSPSECPISLGTAMPIPCLADSRKPTSREGIKDAVLRGYDLRSSSFRHQAWRVLTFAVVDQTNTIQGIVQVSHEATGEETALHELRILLIAGSIVGLLLAALGSLFLAGRSLVPIREAFARQRQFTADASHELRTPLALIRANAEMLYRHEPSLPEGDGELIGEIIRETDHLSRLVSDLLTLARADTESLQIESRPVDFRNLVEEVHEDLHQIAEAQGIHSDISLNGPVTIQGDPTRLRQLLLILLDNSLKYTDPGGRVDVAVGKEDGRARLIVEDTGIGIPPEDLPHIFERFYRVDRAREHESGGTGLGLAIARWIVQAHHGTIKVDSEVGEPQHGTRFQIDLPMS